MSWDKLYDKARWNGLILNILATNRNGARRIQVDDIPNSDIPFINDLGEKAEYFQVETVFAGDNSIADSNAVIDQMKKDPKGTLEHPYLGELNLYYLTFSQKLTTKKNMVVLSLYFVAQGQEITLEGSASKTISNYTDPVLENSKTEFVNEVASASPDKIATIQAEFTSLLTKVRFVANQMQRPSQLLTEFHNEILDGFNSVSSIINSPQAFVDQIGVVMDSLALNAKALTYTRQDATNPTSNRKFAATELKKVEASSTTRHLKLQTTITRLKLSQAFEVASSSTTVSEASQQIQLDNALIELNELTSSLSDRLSESSSAATYDSIDLVDNLNSLNAEVFNQKSALQKLIDSIATEQVYSKTPSMLIAQIAEIDLSTFEGVNAIAHPLFISGEVKIPNG
ncbi:MAG: hypothetical protein DSZ27_07305 [Thiomicrospira sp.]|nr:MAG: hypothetical protein DSZ27_07305 [Thiomicrospira sp.]